MNIRKSNRHKAKAPRKRKFWCGCDAAKVGQSGKCLNCGASHKGVKSKKAGPSAEVTE